jgi:hypothetical protein
LHLTQAEGIAILLMITGLLGFWYFSKNNYGIKENN